MKFLVFMTAFVMMWSGTTQAENTKSFDSQDRVAQGLCPKPGVVSLAGEVILRIHAPAGGKDCQHRADTVQERIVDSLGIGLVYPADIIVKKQRNEWAVFVKDILIITADSSSARVNRTSPRLLAEIWAKNLRRTIPESTPQKPGVHGPPIPDDPKP